MIRLRGRLIGDDVYLQRALFAAACEIKGAGLLIHPSLGPITVSLAEPPGMSDTYERGRVVELDLSFIQGGTSLFPSILISTQNAVLVAAAAAVLAVATEVATLAQSVPAQSQPVEQAAQQTVASWGAIATSYMTDASLIANEVSGLPGPYGRFVGATSAATPTATLATLRAAVVTARTGVATAVAAATGAASGLFGAPTAVAAACQAVAESVRAVAIAPGDQLRVLGELAGFAPDTMTTSAPIGASIADTITIVGALCRRSAVIAMAEAAQAYQPTSFNDAEAVLTTVVDALDAEITIAGDMGDDGSYLALYSLRASVVDDLTARGASLAPIATFVFAASMPSLVLANRIYGDATREPGLVSEVDPIHPLFMPATFQALGF